MRKARKSHSADKAMVFYNNSAGRILAVLQRLEAIWNGSQIGKGQVAGCLGVPDCWGAILAAMADLHKEYRQLSEDIEQFEDNPSKYELCREALAELAESLNSFQLRMKNGTVTLNIGSLVGLEYIAADLPQDENADESELNRIRELVNELQAEIENATEFSRSVRNWLLDLVRIIRDSLDRYAIRGSYGMRQQVSMLLGELIQNHSTAEKAAKSNPGLFRKFREAIDLMNSIATLAEKCKPMIDGARRLLPFVFAESEVLTIDVDDTED